MDLIRAAWNVNDSFFIGRLQIILESADWDHKQDFLWSSLLSSSRAISYLFFFLAMRSLISLNGGLKWTYVQMELLNFRPKTNEHFCNSRFEYLRLWSNEMKRNGLYHMRSRSPFVVNEHVSVCSCVLTLGKIVHEMCFPSLKWN